MTIAIHRQLAQYLHHEQALQSTCQVKSCNVRMKTDSSHSGRVPTIIGAKLHMVVGQGRLRQAIIYTRTTIVGITVEYGYREG